MVLIMRLFLSSARFCQIAPTIDALVFLAEQGKAGIHCNEGWLQSISSTRVFS
jgi:hypothetical protein